MTAKSNCMAYVNFDIDFELLLYHCAFVKKVIEKEQAKIEAWFKTATIKLTEDQKEEFYDRYGDEGYYVNELFPGIQWSSMFVTAFNLFEKTLDDMCIISGSISNSSVKLRDLSDNGIQRAKTYLSKVQNIKDPFRSNEWRLGQDYSKIRNVLAHAYGEIDLRNDKNNKFLNIAKKTKGMKVSREDLMLRSANIVVEEQLVFDSIATYRKIVGQVHKLLIQKAN